MQPGRARTSGLGVPLLPLARWVGWVAPVRPTHGVLVLSCPSAALRVCSVLGRWAPVHRCAVVRLRCPGPAGSCSPVCSLGVLCCMCGVLGHWAPVHRCACCVRCTCAMGGCVPLLPPLIIVFFFLFFFFVFFFFFFEKKKKKKRKKKKKKKQKREKQGRAYTAGTGMGSWCGGAIALCPLACVVGAVAAVAPQGCGSRVLMYTGMRQGGFG